MPAPHDIAATTSTSAATATYGATSTSAATAMSGALVTTATSQPALRTGFVMLGLASLLDLSTGRRGAGADRVLAMSGAAAAGWYLVESRRHH